MTSIADGTFQLRTAAATGAVRLRNLTGRPVVVAGDGDRVVLVLEAEACRVPALDAARVEAGWLEGGRRPVPVVVTVRQGVRNLPAPRPEVLLVVPRLIAESCPQRDDLVYPDRLVRDAAGQIVGCRAFGSVALAPEEVAR